MNAEAKTLATILRDDERARVRNTLPMGIDEVVVDRIASKMPAWLAADILDRLPTPVEGVGLTRYTIERSVWSDELGAYAPGMRLDPEGEWVWSDDATAALAAKEAERNGIVENLGRALEDRAKKDGEIAVLLRERDALKARVAHLETCLEASDEVRAALSPAQGGE